MKELELRISLYCIDSGPFIQTNSCHILPLLHTRNEQKGESVPVAEFLQSENLLRSVQCEKAVEEVWKDVRALFGPTVVFVLGGPGAGKGTLCGKIACGYRHLSAGDLLREERKRPGSKFGELIEAHIKDGQLVPASIVVELILQAMREQGWEGGKYLIDGFPRRMSFDNLEAWRETVRDQVLVRFVLYLDVSEQARLLERGKTSGRADDNIESIRKRFLTFHKESMPVVEHFQKKGRVLFGPSVVFVLGGPGAGKGTQCTRIAAGAPREGKLVPVEITIKLLKQAMMKFGWEGGRYLVDGFPRSFDNLRGWEDVIGNTVRVKFVLFFDLSEETMQARLVERGKTSGRADDNLESIKKRFITFQQESMPVVEQFHLKGLVRRINAEQSPEKAAIGHWSGEMLRGLWDETCRVDVNLLLFAGCTRELRNFGPSVIFVLGGPGAGKGTQCTRIAANFGFQHLSAGDLLREERKRPGSELGWNDIVGQKVDVKCCIFFDCSEAVMEARLLERGKTSGRADDNLESIRKRFTTYTQEPWTPSAINAEQSLDEVWSCVQEADLGMVGARGYQEGLSKKVMRNERDGLLLNQAGDQPAVAQPLSALAAASLVATAGAPWRRLLKDCSWRLYRGEAGRLDSSVAMVAISAATRLQPTPDLLEESTYGKEGLTYFEWLEKQLQKRPGAPSVLRGHLGGDRKQAANWGDACAVWPLGDVRYAWPSDSECFWESGKGARQLRVNEDTGVLFESDGYLAVPSGSEPSFEEALAALPER
eukprot:s2680_g3.t1